MNKSEIAVLLALNKANYPDSQYRNMSKEELTALIDNWHHHFADYPAETIMAIYYEAQKSSHFPIKIADIFDKMKSIKAANMKSTEQLWQEFTKAAKKAYDLSYYFRFDFVNLGKGEQTGREIRQEAQEYFDSLDPELKRYAGDLRRLISFGEMDRDHLEQIIQPSFRRCMEADRQRNDILEMTSPAALQIGQAGIKMIGE